MAHSGKHHPELHGGAAAGRHVLASRTATADPDTGGTVHAFDRGDGGATLAGAVAADSLVFTATMAYEVRLARVGDDLLIRYGYGDDSADVITIEQQFAGGGVGRIEFGDGARLDTAGLALLPTLYGTEGDDRLAAAADWSLDDRAYGYGGADMVMDDDGGGNNTLDGGDGDDYVAYANSGTTSAEGGAGNDIIVANIYVDPEQPPLPGDGAITVTGGGGDDLMIGGFGAETYVIRRGDGVDVIRFDYGGADRIVFGPGIAVADITFSQLDTMLVLRIGDPSDPQAVQTVTLENWFGADGSRYLDTFEFADGSMLDAAQATAAGTALRGTGGADLLRGYAETRLIEGLDGDDAIRALSTNVVLRGGAGNDSIVFAPLGTASVDGGSGNDTILGWGAATAYENTLAGGAGDDIVEGSSGRDAYLFDRGDGHDTLHDEGAATLADRLVFGTGIVAADVAFTRLQNDLLVSVANPDNPGADTVLVRDWYLRYDCRLESLQFANGTQLSSAQATALAGIVSGTAGNDRIIGYADTRQIDGLAGDDTLVGGYGSTLRGGAGNDRITFTGNVGNTVEGGSGDDVLLVDAYGGSGAGIQDITGGTGNDTITTYGETDIIRFRRGDGNDTIVEWGGNSIDRLVFGAGIAMADLRDSRLGNDLLLQFADPAGAQAADSIRLRDWFVASSYRIERLEFADAGVLAGAQLSTLGALLQGTDGNDSLGAYGETRVMEGYGGNDTLTGTTATGTMRGGAGNDELRFAYGANNTIDGGSGNDTLNGGGGSSVAGHSRLTGGTGDDVITGTYGATTYYYQRGDGRDIVGDYGDSGVVDRFVFGAGIGQGDLAARRSQNDLVLTIAGSENGAGEAGDQITVTGWFSGASRVIERLEFADGSALTAAQLGGMAFGTAGADTIVAAADASLAQHLLGGLAGNDSLGAGQRGALLLGGAGNDTLHGGAAADFLYGGSGNDTVIAGTRDVIGFNAGDGADTVTAAGGAATLSLGVGAGVDLGLGAGLDPARMQLAQAGADLVLDFGGADSITLKDWYGAGPTAQGIGRLQLVGSAGAPGDPQSATPSSVQCYDFHALVNAFDAARAADSTLAAWNAGAGLPAAFQAAWTGAAIGGVLAVDIAAHGGVTLLAPVFDTVRANVFGLDPQAA